MQHMSLNTDLIMALINLSDLFECGGNAIFLFSGKKRKPKLALIPIFVHLNHKSNILYKPYLI